MFTIKYDQVDQKVGPTYAVAPLPDFFESGDFFEPISRKSVSVNTEIGESVTPNFGINKIRRVCYVRLQPIF